MKNKHNRTPAKQPHLAWRISRTFLHILGRVVLWVLIFALTAGMMLGIAGYIFMNKGMEYFKADVIPKAEEYVQSLDLDNIELAQTSVLYCRNPKTGVYEELQQLHASQNRIWVSYDQIPKDLINADLEDACER